MHKIVRALVPASTAMFLAACGGGSSAPPPEHLVEITSANAPTIAGAVMKTTYEGSDLGDFADVSGGIGAAPQKAASVYSKLGEVQADYTKPMLTESQVGTFQAPITPMELPCPVDGSVVVSGDIQNPNTLTANDVLTFEFMGCDDGVSVADGTMSMTILEFTGDFVGGSVSFVVSVNLDDFTVTVDGESQTANGDITISMDLPNSGPLTMTVESHNLTIDDGTSTSSLASFSLTQTIDPATGVYTLTVSGRVDSSVFEGSANFSTSVSLEGDSAEPAHVGELVITGDANATITIVVLDEQLVRLNVDLDGDGETDETIDMTWDELA